MSSFPAGVRYFILHATYHIFFMFASALLSRSCVLKSCFGPLYCLFSGMFYTYMLEDDIELVMPLYDLVSDL